MFGNAFVLLALNDIFLSTKNYKNIVNLSLYSNMYVLPFSTFYSSLYNMNHHTSNFELYDRA